MMRKTKEIVKAFMLDTEGKGTGKGVQRTTGNVSGTGEGVQRTTGNEGVQRTTGTGEGTGNVKELDYIQQELQKISIKPKYIKIRIK